MSEQLLWMAGDVRRDNKMAVRSWLTSIDDQLRRIYAAITCRRATDVAHDHAAQDCGGKVLAGRFWREEKWRETVAGENGGRQNGGRGGKRGLRKGEACKIGLG